MGTGRLFLVIAIWVSFSSSRGDERNLSPVFVHDMNNLALSESTPVGHLVYTLAGEDPEGAPIRYGLVGTDKLAVDPDTGEVTLVKPLDRETNDTLKLLVSIEEVSEQSNTNRVQLPISVIVLDENDNAPVFKNSPYEVTVAEDAAVGATLLQDILVEDLDSIGDSLEVGCVASPQWAESCETLEVVSVQSSQSEYRGALVLRAPLDYGRRQFYQLSLVATDGTLNSTASVEVTVQDVQNSPPVFSGSLTAAVSEDAPIGTTVLTVQAADGDRASPRNISYDLLTNPHDFFLLDHSTGELKTGKPLDREALADPSAPLRLVVRAREVVGSQPSSANHSSTTATVAVSITDVNDEPPRFNRMEYAVEIPENFPVGSALPNLDMVVTDTDLGKNGAFSLRLSDVSGAFAVEPATASGRALASIRLNNTHLDYEQTDMSKFIIVVIAEELHTSPPLSSKATLVVTVTDVNDNAPHFAEELYWARVSETAPPGSHVVTITATDRDTGRLGTEGIVYQLLGSGSELFTVDNRTGVISVAPCATPGRAPCLDVETRREYFLSFKATDEDGAGMNSVVPLKISVSDANDNAPAFPASVYRAVVDEDATKFDPELQVQARDADETSELVYSIAGDSSQFWIDAVTGKLGVRGQIASSHEKPVFLTVLASDGVHNATCEVQIEIKDVNNHSPVFDTQQYVASVSEEAAIGTEVATVHATDMDTGSNAELKYSIEKGSLDHFAIDGATGAVAVAADLDYDKRNTYRILVVAQDKGVPSLTGTAELVVTVINANDKVPYFTPQIQRAQVSADAEVGTLVHTLTAMDPDILNIEDLKFEVSPDRPVQVVDNTGVPLKNTTQFADWFVVSPSGAVLVAKQLDRSKAFDVTLPLVVTDPTASEPQTSEGELVITLVEVNRHAPVFAQSHYAVRVQEEQPPAAELGRFAASDRDSKVAHYAIEPPSAYFTIDNVTGAVRSTQRVDYEKVRRVDFAVVAYDDGDPQLSANATVTVDVVNVNDEQPGFDSPEGYEASVVENAKEGTPVVTVHATDEDEGKFGEVRYSLGGEHASKFTIDPITGEVAVARGAVIDRERLAELWVRVAASDVAPSAVQHTASAPIHIRVVDANDNAPVFSQRVYKATISENISLDPPAPVIQVQAEDADTGANALLAYAIVDQNVTDAFHIDPTTGIVFPAAPVAGNATYRLTVRATDRNGTGPHSDAVTVDINVLSVNKHAPVFIKPSGGHSTVEIPENAASSDMLVLTVLAEDEDPGEEGRVSYYLREGDNNTAQTEEFAIDESSGQLRTKVVLDREATPTISLILVARDHGSPAFESLHFLTVQLRDDDDNLPLFEQDVYSFSIPENQPAGLIIGSVKAVDMDSGDNGMVYYHILDGNDDGAFVLDRTQGLLRANISFDREKRSEYALTLQASNSALLDRDDSVNDVAGSRAGDRTTTAVRVHVADLNDNEPVFEENDYYAGIQHTSPSGEEIIRVVARDADAAPVAYVVAASHLYRAGDRASSGSVVPSPFNVSADGVVVTATDMEEYNQERFVLDIVAQETEAPHRSATAKVHVWILNAGQTLRVVLSRACEDAAAERARLQRRLAAATGERVVAGAAHHYVHKDRLYEDWCELRIHAVDKESGEAMPAARLLAAIDAKYDQLSDLYRSAGVETLAPSVVDVAETRFDPALAALVALLVILFVGLVAFVVVCACLRHWNIPPPSLESSKGDSLARRRILDELSTTENPLWLETKLRPYEEQELTMNVFGDHEPTGHVPPTDNTYATIPGGGGGERDYATLTPLEAALGFQGSTFQPPAPETPEPPPRPGAPSA